MVKLRLSKKQIKRKEENKSKREASKNKIIRVLIEEGSASNSTLEQKSGFGHNYTNELLKKLKEEETVVNINPEGKHPLYATTKLSESLVLQFLSTKFLHHLLEKINDSKDKDKSIAEFTRYFGSLITYIFKHYNLSQSQEILSPILLQIEAYLNYPKTWDGATPVLKQEPAVETVEWQLWREFDSRDFIKVVPFEKIERVAPLCTKLEGESTNKTNSSDPLWWHKCLDCKEKCGRGNDLDCHILRKKHRKSTQRPLSRTTPAPFPAGWDNKRFEQINRRLQQMSEPPKETADDVANKLSQKTQKLSREEIDLDKFELWLKETYPLT